MTENNTPAPRGKRHLDAGPQGMPRYVLVPGDPARVPIIGREWDSYSDVSFQREFRVARGTFRGVDIAACSTGIGGPSTEIAALELKEAGADTFIRVGTCASLQEHIACGDVVIQHAAVRGGAAEAWAARDYPAVADVAVTQALIEACAELGLTAHVGITASVDSFYAGQENPVPGGGPLPAGGIVDYLTARNVATFEMEAATLFVLGSVLGFRTGSICAVGSNRVTRQRADPESTVAAISRAASLAVVRLASQGG
jgi:uridine phosphorylase